MRSASPTGPHAPRTALTTDGDQNASLSVDGLVVHRQGVAVINGVTFTLRPGELLAILGANGAGKSTLLDAISGLLPVSSGTVLVHGIDVGGLPVQARANLVTHVPEGRHLFPDHTVRENLMLGASGASNRVVAERLADVYRRFPDLSALRDRRAGQLSGGQQQMVALGRGLMSGTRVLLVDELSLGLAPKIATSFISTLADLRDGGYSILLVEQYASLAFSAANRIAVLSRGRFSLEGTPDELRSQTEGLRESYLGGPQPPDHAEAVAVQSIYMDARPAVGTGAGTQRQINDPAQPGLYVSIIGCVVLGASFAAPWLSFSNYLQQSGYLFVWDLPQPWWLVIVADGASLIALGTAVLLRPRQRIGRRATLFAVVAFAALTIALVVDRCWFSTGGIPPLGRIYERSWGLLVALHGIAFMALGVVRYVRHAYPFASQRKRAAV